jgi:hypothetical protein
LQVSISSSETSRQIHNLVRERRIVPEICNPHKYHKPPAASRGSSRKVTVSRYDFASNSQPSHDRIAVASRSKDNGQWQTLSNI